MNNRPRSFIAGTGIWCKSGHVRGRVGLGKLCA
jgi:hypothetical protein